MKYLGLDWGMKKIGMAVSNGELAATFGSLEVSGFEQAIQKVTDIIKKENVETVIIGLPEGEMGKAVLKVADRLSKEGVEVELADETLSSKNALTKMIELGVSQKARREDHSMAAMLLLQEYLDMR